jgi:hypothetical protein
LYCFLNNTSTAEKAKEAKDNITRINVLNGKTVDGNCLILKYNEQEYCVPQDDNEIKNFVQNLQNAWKDINALHIIYKEQYKEMNNFIDNKEEEIPK